MLRAIANRLNAARVWFAQSGIGAVADTVEKVLQREKSVFDWMTAAQRADVLARTALVDVTTALNDAFAFCSANNIALKMPAGIYKISDTLWPTEEGTTFQSFHITGSGSGYVGSSIAQTVIDATFTTKPAINMAMVRGGYLGHLHIKGGGKDIYTDLAVADMLYDSDWVGAARDSRYSPYCAICIDGGVGPTPPDGGYSGFTYRGSGSGSATIEIDNVTWERFVVGVMHNPENGAQQGDDIIIKNPYSRSTKVAIASGQSQSRCITLIGGTIVACRTAYDGLEYGVRQGSAPLIIGTQYVFCFELFATNPGFNPLTVIGGRAEEVHRIGQAGTGSSTIAHPTQFTGLEVALLSSSTGKRCPIVWDSASAGLNWTGGSLQQGGTHADALLILAEPAVLENVQIGVLNRFRPYIGGAADLNTPLLLKNCRVRDASAAVLYGGETRRFSLSGRISEHWSGGFRRTGDALDTYHPNAGNTYKNIATASAYVFTDTTLEFDNTNASRLLVGDILNWRFNAIGNTTTQITGPGLKITAIVSTTVTCSLLYDRDYYDEAYAPANTSVLVHEWAPGQSLTGDLTGSSTTLANVSPTTILQNGDWIASVDSSILGDTRVASGGGTATITMTRVAAATRTGAPLFWGEMVSLAKKALAQTTAVGNVGSGTDDLQSVSLPTGTLWRAGKGVKIAAWGTTANNSNPKTVTLAFGATTLISTALTVSQAGVWRIDAEVVSTGVDAQQYIAQLVQGGTTTLLDVEQGTAAIDDGAAITIKCTGTVTDGGGGINNNDIVQEGLVVTHIN